MVVKSIIIVLKDSYRSSLAWTSNHNQTIFLLDREAYILARPRDHSVHYWDVGYPEQKG